MAKKIGVDRAEPEARDFAQQNGVDQDGGQTAEARGRGRPTVGNAPKSKRIAVRVDPQTYDDLQAIGKILQIKQPGWSLTTEVTEFLQQFIEQHRGEIDEYDRLHNQGHA